MEIHLPDPDDEPFLEVALAGKVEAIVTGNKRHFPKKEYKGFTRRSFSERGVKILSPAEFLEGLKVKI